MPGPEQPAGTVLLDLAVDHATVRLARLTASDLAARAGFDVEEIDDLCRGVEVLCQAVLAGPPGAGSLLHLRFELLDSALIVEGRGTGRQETGREDALHRLLDVLLDEHELVDDEPVFRAHKRRGDRS